MSSQVKYIGIFHVLDTPKKKKKKRDGLKVLILDSSSDLLHETSPTSSRNTVEKEHHASLLKGAW